MSNQPPLTPSTNIGQYSTTDTAYRYFAVIPVDNGVAYLDMYYPGWEQRIDLRTLNMRYTSADILAQIHGTDVRGTPEYRDWSFRSLVAHGFYTWDRGDIDYDSLTLRWRAVIDARLTRGPR